MSTEIQSVFTNSTAVLTIRPSGRHRPSILVCADESDSSAAVAVPRADFLAAVEAECGVRLVAADAIVIERAELPKVVAASLRAARFADGTLLYVDDEPDARWRALRWLALAEYLDAHPPTPLVDEADVETLAGILSNEGDGGIWEHLDAKNSHEVARRLLATGRVSVT